MRDASCGASGAEAGRLIRSLTLRVGRKGEDLMGVKHVNMHSLVTFYHNPVIEAQHPVLQIR